MEFILTSIKKLIGIEPEDINFDPDIIMFINMALMALTRLGVGPSAGYVITGATEKWTDFIGDRKDVEGIKTFVHLKVKLVFDPPLNSFLIKAIEDQIKELEWTINSIVDPYVPVVPVIVEEGGF